jgi:hypothetical protein
MSSFTVGPTSLPVMKDGAALVELLAEMDRLIDWYYKHRPGYTGPLTLPATFKRFDVRKMLGRLSFVRFCGEHYEYRGMTVVVRTESKARWTQ